MKLPKFLRRLFRLGSNDKTMTEDELRNALIEGEKSGIVEREERDMVEGVFYLGDRTVETFMTHRSDLEWLELDSGEEEARSIVFEHGEQNYFPVARETLDELVGIVSALDILKALLSGPWPGLKAIMTEARMVPQSMPALKALESFKDAFPPFLCVIDEYGGFAGSLTVENLVEEIVGALGSAGADEAEILPQEDGSYLVDGAVNIDDLMEELNLKEQLGEHPEYHTLAGFILNLAETIPHTGANFSWEGYRFKIVDMDGNRIDKLQVFPPKEN